MIKALLTLLAFGLMPLSSAAVAPSLALPNAYAPDELEPLSGSLLLAGEGALSDAVRSAFVDLAGGGAAHIVELAGPGKGEADATEGESPDWTQAGAAKRDRIEVSTPEDLLKPPTIVALLGAGGIWIDQLPAEVLGDPVLQALLSSALDRGAAVGAGGEDARRLTGVPGVDEDRLCLAPRIELVFGVSDVGNTDPHHKAARNLPGRIVVALADGAAVALFGGRSVACLGSDSVGFAIYRDGPTQVDEQVFQGAAHRPGNPLESRLDLLSWIRQARQAEQPVFPPSDPAKPTLAKGTLLVQGGGGVSEDTWNRYIDLAGGIDAQFVCIPSASEFDDDHAPRSYSAQELRERGCMNVTIAHAGSRTAANQDRRILASLAAADAVWIDGGRTFRFMDRIGETHAEAAIRAVLERGGVVGGSSAGCQVVGDFLVRGNPRSNSEMTFEGYTRGMGLLGGVVIDAHFIERRRQDQLARLVRVHPQLLGLGIDAGSALLVQGSVGEVLGTGAGVVVYDGRTGEPLENEGVRIKAGERFDLVTGTRVGK